MAKATTASSDEMILEEMPLSATIRLKEPPAPKPPITTLYVFELCTKVKPRGPESAPFTPYKTLSAEQTVYDEKAKRERTLRYLKGINTIWVDEQQALELGDRFVSDIKNWWIPEFKEGKLFLSTPKDQLKIDIMLNRDDYEGKTIRLNPEVPAIYRWANQNTKSEIDLELRRLRKKATDLALSAAYDDILAHASYLGIGFKDMYQQEKTPDAIRGEYFDKADKEPKLFLESFDSPTVKFRFLIKAALEAGKIDLNHVKGQACWKDSKALIKVLDNNKTPINDLTDFAFTEGGNVFYKEISKS